jgi:hypothetical protein
MTDNSFLGKVADTIIPTSAPPTPTPPPPPSESNPVPQSTLATPAPASSWIDRQVQAEKRAEQWGKNQEAQMAGEKEYSDYLYRTAPEEYKQANPGDYYLRKIHGVISDALSEPVLRSMPDNIRAQVEPHIRALADVGTSLYGVPPPGQGLGPTEGVNAQGLVPFEGEGLEAAANEMQSVESLPGAMVVKPAPTAIEELPGAQLIKPVPTSVADLPGAMVIKEVPKDDLQAVADHYGTSENPSGHGASFITPNGKFINLASTEHDSALKATFPEQMTDRGYGGPLRKDFINETGAIRVRHSMDRSGPTAHISVPAQGVEHEQIPALQKAIAHVGKYGNVVMERADVTPETKDQLTMSQEFARPSDAEKYLKQIQAHPEQRMVRDILDAHAATGGSTFNMKGENLKGTDNFSVGMYPERGQIIEGPLTQQHVQDFIDKNHDLLSKPENSVGTWGNEGKNYLDVVRAVPDRENAIQIAKANNQIAIYDLKTGEEIPTGGTGTIPDEGAEFRFGANIQAEPGQNTISSRFPTATKATENPTAIHDMTVDRETLQKTPGLLEKVAAKVREYPGFKAPEGDASVVNDAFVRHVADNLKWLYEKTTPEEREMSRQWYPVGAHQMTGEMATTSGLTHSQTAGVVAAMSPQKDWDMNISLARRAIDVYTNHQDTETTPEMLGKLKEIAAIPANKELGKMARLLKGKTFGELDGPEKALWLRLYDEAHNPRTYEAWSPNGVSKGLQTKMNGEPAKLAWGSLNEIGKGIAIMADGSRENISARMGKGHKIRSFYNNIIEPDSTRNDVTVDTHAVAAGLMRPLGSYDSAVKDNFGHAGKSAITGVQGTYPLFADAYRTAAKELDIQHPNQLQSIIWEHARNLFNSEFKTPENKAAIDGIWKEYENGGITADAAREKIYQYARGRNKGANGEGRNPSDQGELPTGGFSWQSAAGSGAGTRGRSKAGRTNALDLVKALETWGKSRQAKKE